MKRCLQNYYEYLYFNCCRIFTIIFVFGWQLSEIAIAIDYKDNVKCEKPFNFKVTDWLIIKSFFGITIILFSGLNFFSNKKTFINDVSKYLLNMACFIYIILNISYIFILSLYCGKIEPQSLYIYTIFSMIYGFIFSFKIIKTFNLKKKDTTPLLDINNNL